MNTIKIRCVKKVRREDFTRLYKEAGWWKGGYDKDLSFIGRVVKRSFCFMGAFYKGKMIGMGRSISDGIGDAYIQDVIILKEFRGKGLGKKIIKKITEYLLSKGIDWIGTIAEPGTKKFYGKLGFKIMKKYTPMLWYDKNG